MFELTGHPIEKYEAHRIVAANFFACASSFDAYFRACNNVFIIVGWDLDAEEQRNVNCLMGMLFSWCLSYEESTRRGCHAHGCAHQLVMQVDVLQRLHF